MKGADEIRFAAHTPPTVFVVFADPEPEDEAEFHEWYDDLHGPDALANGSFISLNRFVATGAGHRAAPYLAFWEGRFPNEREAWDFIRPKALELREAGRAGDVASVAFAIMLVRGRTGEARVADAAGVPASPVRSLVTVQNDWRDAPNGVTFDQWWDTAGLDNAPESDSRWLLTSDPNGRGGGYHLAAFGSSASPEQTQASWAGFAPTGISPGTSPVDPYTNLFGITSKQHPDDPDRATGWLMHWTPIASQRIADR